uniref:Sushi domain-containing protein 3-like n=1 Tax=Labrus bergylta TaxID=56723 RepID=A0A3Q3EKJ9_9LABR
MSAATASITDVSRTNFINGLQSQNQCTPMPLPALGTQKIIQGNGTNVGTIISLQCPAKHKLMGGELTCVLGPNSTQWVGQNYCKPLSPFEDYGFRVAVLASIVSSAIIFFMSMAFITCCLLDCIKEDKRKQHESDPDMWQWEEPPQQQEDRRSRYSPKSRNNNNNNTQEKLSSLWDTKMATSFLKGKHLKSPVRQEVNDQLPVFSSTDIINSTPINLSARVAQFLCYLLSLAVTMTSLYYPETHSMHRFPVNHLNAADLLSQPFKVQVQALTRSQQ